MPENAAYHAAAALNPLNLFGRLFSNNPLDDINATIETLRANLPAFLDQWDPGERDEDDAIDDDEDEEDIDRHRNLTNESSNDRVDTLERLVCYFQSLFVSL